MCKIWEFPPLNRQIYEISNVKISLHLNYKIEAYMLLFYTIKKCDFASHLLPHLCRLTSPPFVLTSFSPTFVASLLPFRLASPSSRLPLLFPFIHASHLTWLLYSLFYPQSTSLPPPLSYRLKPPCISLSICLFLDHILSLFTHIF